MDFVPPHKWEHAGEPPDPLETSLCTWDGDSLRPAARELMRQAYQQGGEIDQQALVQELVENPPAGRAAVDESLVRDIVQEELVMFNLQASRRRPEDGEVPVLVLVFAGVLVLFVLAWALAFGNLADHSNRLWDHLIDAVFGAGADAT